MYKECPTRWRPQGRPRTCCRGYNSRLVWKDLGKLQEELESVARDTEVWTNLLHLLPLWPSPWKTERKWIHNWNAVKSVNKNSSPKSQNNQNCRCFRKRGVHDGKGKAGKDNEGKPSWGQNGTVRTKCMVLKNYATNNRITSLALSAHAVSVWICWNVKTVFSQLHWMCEDSKVKAPLNSKEQWLYIEDLWECWATHSHLCDLYV